eukprot:1152229-Pelagomonas_calceolata.AAC.1
MSEASFGLFLGALLQGKVTPPTYAGNVFAASHNSLPDPEFYFRGRASDQPDYLDASTNGSVQSWTITNYAFSTATACPSDGPEEFVLSVPEQAPGTKMKSSALLLSSRYQGSETIVWLET